MSTSTIENIAIGTRVLVTKGLYLDGLPVEGVLVEIDPTATLSGEPHPYVVEVDRDSKTAQENGGPRVLASEVRPLESSRPMIDFSTESRRTARDFAKDLPSRVLDERHNKVLRSVGVGSKQVDAYVLNEALMAAMRSGATRFGQSMQRRDFTRKVAHLAYIVQATLNNHADGLPVYEPGARSPRIKELEVEVEHAGVVNQSLTEDLTAARAEVHSLKIDLSAATEQNERYVAEMGKTDERLAAYEGIAREAEIRLLDADQRLEKAGEAFDEVSAVLAYAFEQMTPCQKQRVFGYWDGLRNS